MTALELPKGWEWKTLGDVCEIVGGSTPSTKNPSFWDGPISWLAVSDLSGYTKQYIERGARTITQSGYDSCATRLVPAGTVLFSSRAPIGYVAIASGTVCTSQGFRSFVPGSEISSEFLYWYLKSIKPLAEAAASGTTFKELSGKAAARLPVPVPPLEEQQAIVSKVADLDAQWATAKADLEETGRLIRVARRSLFALADRDEDEEVDLGNLIDRIEAGKSLSGEGRPATGTEWGVVKVSAMTWGVFDPEENKALVDQSAADPRNEIRPGDLLFSRANTTELVGASVLVPADVRDKLLLSDKSLRLVPTAGVEAAWLRAALNAPRVRSQMSALATGTSDSMRNISQAKLRQVRVHLPSQAEQVLTTRVLTQRLEELSVLEAELRAAFKDAELLRSAILRAATSGRLHRERRDAQTAEAYL